MKWTPFLTPVKSIDFEEANEFIKRQENSSITILDVRQLREYEEGHIPGATIIPLPELEDRLNEIDPEKPTLVYCAVGGRSRVAAQMIAEKGFKEVYNLLGGINTWDEEVAFGAETQGLSLFTGQESPEEIIKAAYSLEAGLRSFYIEMKDTAQNADVAELFSMLSEIEVKHQETLFKQFIEISGQQITKEAFEKTVEQKAIEGGMSTEEYIGLFNTDLNSAVDIVSLAMSIEAQALDLYHRVGRKLENETAKKIIHGIEKDEKRHLEHLGKLMDSLQKPENK